MRDVVLASAFAALCLFGPIALALLPHEGEAVAVIARPWSDTNASGTVAAADGRLLDLAANNLVAIAVDASPDFVSRLYAAGALLVVDARIAAFCFRRPEPTKQAW